MNFRERRMNRRVGGALLLALGMAIAPVALAQELEPSELNSSEASDFLGDWTLHMEFQGNPVAMTLKIADVGGKVGASLKSPQRPEPMGITDITKTGEGLAFSYEVDFGGQSAKLNMNIAFADGKLSGKLADEGGFFEAEFTGSRAESGSGGGAAPAVKASSLNVSEADGYIGSWTVSMKLRDNPVTMTVQFLDVGGKVAALIKTPIGPDPVEVTDITLTDDGLKLQYETSFGAQQATINVFAKLEGGKLTGSFGDSGGFIKADFTGERSEVDLVAARPTPDQQQRRRSRRRGAGSEARATIQGSELRITYAGLKSDSDDFKKLIDVPAGSVFKFVGGRAMKMKSESDLVFGDTVVKTENAAKNYPGVYSMWLKKTNDGWNLLFNSDADIWGTQHLSSADVVEVPLVFGDAAEEKDRFTLEIDEESDGGTLRIVWGGLEWKAPFTLGETTIAKASE